LTGVFVGATAPATSILWADTSIAASLGVPTGGSTGNYLVKSSNNDYDTAWSSQATAYKNLVINGDMSIAQRSTSVASITGAGYNTADRWYLDLGTLGTWTQSIENDAPTGSGFRKSLKMLCTTADASPAAGDYNLLVQRFEGQNLQQIAKGTSSAKQLTLSFWVKSNATGTYILELWDADNTRNISKSYTISASATWEFKTLTFTSDTTGAFDNDNARSLDVNFWLGAGSTFSSGTLNTSWNSNTNANRAVGQTNVAAATNNYWQVTGVQLEVGPVATGYEFLPYDVELRQCQRYLPGFVYAAANTALPITGRHNSTSASKCWAVFPTTTRVAPTGITISSAGHFIAYDHAGDNRSCTGVTFDYAGLNAATLNLANTSANFISGNSFVLGTNNSAAYILFTGCEL
jgi:hypothetical protein